MEPINVNNPSGQKPNPPVNPPLNPIEQLDPSFQVMPQDGRAVPQPTKSNLKPPLPPRPGLSPLPISRDLIPVEARSSRRWLYVIVLVVALALAGLLYYMLGAKKSVEPTNPAVVSKLPSPWLQQYFQKTTCDQQTLCGDNADPDKDGLSNFDEFRNGTTPINSDSDGDGLADGDEVNIYKTEPTLKYTDRRDIVQQNNWTDGVQVANSYDPLTPAQKFTDSRKQQIASDTAKFNLHEPTTATLNTVITNPTP